MAWETFQIHAFSLLNHQVERDIMYNNIILYIYIYLCIIVYSLSVFPVEKIHWQLSPQLDQRRAVARSLEKLFIGEAIFCQQNGEKAAICGCHDGCIGYFDSSNWCRFLSVGEDFVHQYDGFFWGGGEKSTFYHNEEEFVGQAITSR